MRCVLKPEGDDYLRIYNETAGCNMGEVYLKNARYHVHTDELNNHHPIAVVKSLDQIIPALLAYYRKHPPRWEGGTPTQRSKVTECGTLIVDQEQPGQWVASRNGEFPLLRDGKPAVFATHEAAEHAADAHMRDGFPGSREIDDGCAWLAGAWQQGTAAGVGL